MSNLLNLGCGKRFHPEWENLDIQPAAESVRTWNVKVRLPFADGSLGCCYASHLLEHLQPGEGRALLEDCHRVLKPGGVIRIVVPDLESIARQYLTALDAVTGDSATSLAYDWSVLEMIDQLVRVRSGGAVRDFLANASTAGQELVLGRWGSEAAALLEDSTDSLPAPKANPIRRSLGFLRRGLSKWLTGIGSEEIRSAAFRASGEVHQWMYDRYSLARLLAATGFREVVRRSATQSYLEEWPRFELDAGPSGEAHKPDSLFMEARKPLI